MNTFKYSIGNLKIGEDTLIFNMGSANNCPSAKLGLCKIEKCYAKKAEYLYPSVLPYRNEQEQFWLENDAFTIAEEIQKAFMRNLKTELKFVRVNEAGDFHARKCLNKLIAIATMLPHIKFYTYTHRSDLIDSRTWKKLPKNLVINTSNFTRKNLNSFSGISAIRVHRLAEFSKVKAQIIRAGYDYACLGDCSKCSLCKIQHGKKIGAPIH
jgi:hypothetical protein